MKSLIFTALILSCFSQMSLAQNWVLGGNNNATNSSKLGTMNGQALKFFANGSEQARIATNGRIGIGTTAAPGARLQVNSASGEDGLSVFINGSPKFLVHSNGGVSIGGNNNPQSGGLYVGGYAGVGTSNPAGRLEVKGDATSIPVIKATALNGNPYNVVGISSYSAPRGGTGRYGIGVRSFGGQSGGDFEGGLYGLQVHCSGTGEDSYGIYATAERGSFFTAAGFFEGDVYASRYYLISDRKFKTDIALMKNSLSQIMKLKPSSYKFKQDDLTKTFPEGNQLGLIADEVKQVFPELVKASVRPAEYDKDRNVILHPKVQYEAVNYIGLIPVLIASVQEQQAQINEQQTQINDLKEMVKQLSDPKIINANINSVYLEQNKPNPLNNSTIISYQIPVNSRNARLVVTDISGKTIKEVQLGSSTRGNINFDARGLASGTYTYSILVDGKLAQSKKMTVAKSNY